MVFRTALMHRTTFMPRILIICRGFRLVWVVAESMSALWLHCFLVLLDATFLDASLIV
jgi:hypothetical protein